MRQPAQHYFSQFSLCLCLLVSFHPTLLRLLLLTISHVTVDQPSKVEIEEAELKSYNAVRNFGMVTILLYTGVSLLLKLAIRTGLTNVSQRPT